jgi:signal transduction histidine kinase
LPAAGPAPFLYDLRKDRAMLRDSSQSLRAGRAAERFGHQPLLQLGRGLAVPLAAESGTGQLYLEEIPGLSTDDLELGEQIGTAMTALMQRRALMKAAEDSAEARSRVAIARDLHDSVVQFLAGAAFRLEAAKRSEQAGRPVAAELDELKQLMLQEQGELRAFIAALRSGSQIAMTELARDLQVLAGRLSRQWDIQCTVTATADGLTVPSRLHLDTQQLVREAVANAVRHAGAKNVSIRLGASGDDMRLDFINDGTAYPTSADGGRLPGSLKERVEAAGGVLELSRGMGVTKLSISLPAGARAA